MLQYHPLLTALLALGVTTRKLNLANFSSRSEQRAIIPDVTTSATRTFGHGSNEKVASRLMAAHCVREGVRSSVQLSQEQFKNSIYEDKYDGAGDW